MDKTVGKAVATGSLIIAVGLTCALVVSGEWLIAVGAISGWGVALYLAYTVA